MITSLLGDRQRVAAPPLVDLPHQLFSAALSAPCEARHSRTISSRTWPTSPMMPISVRITLLIDDGSISMWIFFEPGENASSAPGDAVIEARADADHDIAIMHRHVGFIGAVHAQHAQPVACRTPDRRPAPSASR
jgi:hypothetical protein